MIQDPMDDLDYVAALMAEAEEVAKAAESYRALARRAVELGDDFRRLESTRVRDPEDGERGKPALLSGTTAEETTRQIADSLDLVAVTMYGRSGVWEAEGERYATQILAVRAAPVDEGDPWEPRPEA